MKVLHEMTIERSDAIDLCVSNGKKFIEHFHKIYREQSSSLYFHHHCKEMQACFDKCSNLTLKNIKRKITSSDLIDWFFTAGGSVDSSNGFTDNDEIDVYNKFMIYLLADENHNVEETLKKILDTE